MSDVITGHFEAAGAAAQKAVAAQVPEAALEHAKLLWAMDKPYRAILDMQQARSHLECPPWSAHSGVQMQQP